MEFDKLLYDFVGKEIDIQNHIEENIIDILSGIKLPTHKKVYPFHKFKSPIANIICDLFIHHSDNTATIIEVKKFKDETQMASALGQLLLYSEICRCNHDNYPNLVLASNYIPLSLIAITRSINQRIYLLQLDGDRVKVYN